MIAAIFGKQKRPAAPRQSPPTQDCMAIVRSGPRNGEECGRKIAGSQFCGIHSAQRVKARPDVRYCNEPRADGWRCDRPPHEGAIHRNMVIGEMWLGEGARS